MKGWREPGKEKRATSKSPSDAAPTAKEELEIEKRGGGGGMGFEDYPWQPMLSPKAEKDIMPTQNIEKRGNRTTEE